MHGDLHVQCCVTQHVLCSASIADDASEQDSAVHHEPPIAGQPQSDGTPSPDYPLGMESIHLQSNYHDRYIPT